MALYQYGKAQFDQQQYEASYKTLDQLAKLQPSYEDSPRLLQQARARVVDSTTARASLYREEKLKEAIARMARRARVRAHSTPTPSRTSSRRSGC